MTKNLYQFSTIPEKRFNLALAKRRLIKILNAFEINEEIPSEEILVLIHSIENIDSFQELSAKKTEISN